MKENQLSKCSVENFQICKPLRKKWNLNHFLSSKTKWICTEETIGSELWNLLLHPYLLSEIWNQNGKLVKFKGDPPPATVRLNPHDLWEISTGLIFFLPTSKLRGIEYKTLPSTTSPCIRKCICSCELSYVGHTMCTLFYLFLSTTLQGCLSKGKFKMISSFTSYGHDIPPKVTF